MSDHPSAASTNSRHFRFKDGLLRSESHKTTLVLLCQRNKHGFNSLRPTQQLPVASSKRVRSSETGGVTASGSRACRQRAAAPRRIGILSVANADARGLHQSPRHPRSRRSTDPGEAQGQPSASPQPPQAASSPNYNSCCGVGIRFARARASWGTRPTEMLPCRHHSSVA